MAAIHGRDTKPEMKVRRYLWHRGFRFLVNVKGLPGKPDVVLRGRYRVCIFVNGCFWHGHEGCRRYVVPKRNREFWVAKVERNRERDRRVVEELKEMGWHCITIWECELVKGVEEETLERLERTVRMLGASDCSIKDEMINDYAIKDEGLYDEGEEESGWMAAEPVDN